MPPPWISRPEELSGSIYPPYASSSRYGEPARRPAETWINPNSAPAQNERYLSRREGRRSRSRSRSRSAERNRGFQDQYRDNDYGDTGLRSGSISGLPPRPGGSGWYAPNEAGSILREAEEGEYQSSRSPTRYQRDSRPGSRANSSSRSRSRSRSVDWDGDGSKGRTRDGVRVQDEKLAAGQKRSMRRRRSKTLNSLTAFLDAFASAMHAALLSKTSEHLAKAHLARLESFPASSSSPTLSAARLRVDETSRHVVRCTMTMQSSFGNLMRRMGGHSSGSEGAGAGVGQMDLDMIRDRVSRLEESGVTAGLKSNHGPTHMVPVPSGPNDVTPLPSDLPANLPPGAPTNDPEGDTHMAAPKAEDAQIAKRGRAKELLNSLAERVKELEESHEGLCEQYNELENVIWEKEDTDYINTSWNMLEESRRAMRGSKVGQKRKRTNEAVEGNAGDISGATGEEKTTGMDVDGWEMLETRRDSMGILRGDSTSNNNANASAEILSLRTKVDSLEAELEDLKAGMKRRELNLLHICQKQVSDTMADAVAAEIKRVTGQAMKNEGKSGSPAISQPGQPLTSPLPAATGVLSGPLDPSFASNLHVVNTATVNPTGLLSPATATSEVQDAMRSPRESHARSEVPYQPQRTPVGSERLSPHEQAYQQELFVQTPNQHQYQQQQPQQSPYPASLPPNSAAESSTRPSSHLGVSTSHHHGGEQGQYVRAASAIPTVSQTTPTFPATQRWEQSVVVPQNQQFQATPPAFPGNGGARAVSLQDAAQLAEWRRSEQAKGSSCDRIKRHNTYLVHGSSSKRSRRL